MQCALTYFPIKTSLPISASTRRIPEADRRHRRAHLRLGGGRQGKAGQGGRGGGDDGDDDGGDGDASYDDDDDGDGDDDGATMMVE